jgi:hypothetical protein
MLSVAFSFCYAECHYAKYRYAECHGDTQVKEGAQAYRRRRKSSLGHVFNYKLGCFLLQLQLYGVHKHVHI